ncbi:hypothetical protein CDD81_6433 [Ophiocordyceps australis]|uniref:Uncharacterized protein n=1 Tax=Ophiocordyceps australis TaxID=1399860 RepID=A0A2C5YFW6_9HYPO|nr:hypothetical protein CDD81_6433 [Ophiocordyceps australis]
MRLQTTGVVFGLLVGHVAAQDPGGWHWPRLNTSKPASETWPWHFGGPSNEWKSYTFKSRIPSTCVPYETYVQTAHEPRSTGKLKVPYMRPPPECRTFNSSAAEKVVEYMKAHMRDPDLARLFENSFSMPLDTTIKWFDPEKGLSFIVTGERDAQWMRDTELQLAHLYRVLPWDENLRNLFKSIIKTETRFLTNWTFCSAMQPPPESGLPPILNKDPTHKIVSDSMQLIPNHTVYECKWNVASLASFLRISRKYWEHTKDDSFVTPEWTEAVWRIMDVLNVQTRGKMLNEVTQFHFRKRASKPIAPWPRTPAK